MADETIQRVTPVLESLQNAISSQTRAFSSFIRNQMQLVAEQRRETQFEKLRREEETQRQREDTGEKTGMATKLKEIFDKLQTLVPTKDFLGKAALLPVIGFFAGNFAKGFISTVLESIGFDDPETKEAISSSVGSAIQWGAIGSIFGRRIGGWFAVGGLLYNLVDRNFDEISEFFNVEFLSTESLLGGLSATILGSFAVIKGGFSRIGTMITSLTTFFDPVIDTLRPVISKIGPLFSAVGKRLLWPITILSAIFDTGKAFIETEGSILEKSVAGLAALWNNIIQPIQMINSLIAKAASYLGFDETAQSLENIDFTTSFEGIMSFLSSANQMATDAYNWIKNTFDLTVTSITDLPDTISSIVSDTYNSAMGWFRDTYKWTEEGISAGIGSISSIATNTYNSAMNWFSDSYKWAEEGISAGIGSISSIASSTLDSAMNWFDSVFRWSSDTLQQYSLMDVIETSINDIIKYFTNFLPSFDDISKMVGNLVRGTPLSFLLGSSSNIAEPQENTALLSATPAMNNTISETLDGVADRLSFIADATSSLLGFGSSNNQTAPVNVVDGSVRVGGSPNVNSSVVNNHYVIDSEAGLMRTIGIGF